MCCAILCLTLQIFDLYMTKHSAIIKFTKYDSILKQSQVNTIKRVVGELNEEEKLALFDQLSLLLVECEDRLRVCIEQGRDPQSKLLEKLVNKKANLDNMLEIVSPMSDHNLRGIIHVLGKQSSTNGSD